MYMYITVTDVHTMYIYVFVFVCVYIYLSVYLSVYLRISTHIRPSTPFEVSMVGTRNTIGRGK